MKYSVEGWVPNSDGDLIASLVTAQVNHRLIELTLFSKAVKIYGDSESVNQIEHSMSLAKSLPKGVLAAVVSEPEFNYWSYISGCLRGRLENNESIPIQDVPHLASILGSSTNPLYFHILELNRFLLSASFMTCSNAQCLLPLHGRFLFFPGTGLRIDCHQEASIVEVDLNWDSVGIMRIDGRVVERFEIAAQKVFEKELAYKNEDLYVFPWVRMSSGAFLINSLDPYFKNSWVTSYVNADGSHYGEVPIEQYEGWADLFKATVALLGQCWAEMEQDIGKALRVVIPVESPLTSVHMSCSKEVMGFAILMSKGSPVMCAEALVHEFSHNILNSLQKAEDIFNDIELNQSILYSPWRSDPRHFQGLFHAVFVFERVCEFFLRYLKLFDDDEIKYRFNLMAIRNQIGIEILEGNSDAMGEFGKNILLMLKYRIKKHNFDVSERDRFEVKEELVEHYQIWEKENKKARKPNSKTLGYFL